MKITSAEVQKPLTVFVAVLSAAYTDEKSSEELHFNNSQMYSEVFKQLNSDDWKTFINTEM